MPSEPAGAKQRDFRKEFSDYVSKIRKLAALAGLNPKKDARHPAYESLELLKVMLETQSTSQGLKLEKLGTTPTEIVDRQLQMLRALSSYGYDRMYWLADGYFEELMRDPDACKFVAARLPDANQYESTVSELMYWGWLKARGITPKFLEKVGWPDIEIQIDAHGEPIYCDIKAIMPGTSPGRIEAVITKANKQIKNVGGETTKGFCVVRIVEPVVRRPRILLSPGGYHVLECDEKSRDELGIPLELEDYVSEAKKVLSSQQCRSVSYIVMCWEEHYVVGHIPGWIRIVGNRSSTGLAHKHARQKFEINSDFLMKATVAPHINVLPRS